MNVEYRHATPMMMINALMRAGVSISSEQASKALDDARQEALEQHLREQAAVDAVWSQPSCEDRRAAA